jgi:hypothetical protein
MKTLILFALLIVLGETAYGQSTIEDSCICYTDAQDIRCLECLMNYPILVDKVDLLGEIASERIVQLQIASETIQKQYAYIQDLEANLAESERKRGVLKKIAIGLGLAVIGETFAIFVFK